MQAIIALLGNYWPFILAAVGVGYGVLAKLRSRAETAEAQAERDQMRVDVLAGNAQAAQAGVAAATAAGRARDEVEKLDDQALDDEGARLGVLRGQK